MYHKPVLYDEVIEYMINDKYRIYLDCTLGGGGHARGILENSNNNSKLIGIDQDINAINYVSESLKSYSDRLMIFKNNFENMKTVVYMAAYDKVDAILMDIGVSSEQLDNKERGFSYKYDAKLDMRMDTNQELSAYEVVNEYSEKEIADILYKFGEEPKSKKIAYNIVKKRQEKKIETTLELSEIVIRAIGKSMKKHPAKRTFQALRIYVNRELEVLEKAIDEAVDILNPGGRLLIITFHSLEDKMVKRKFRELEDPCTCSKDIPICICNKKPLGKVITRKVVMAKENELQANNRSHSAKLRVFERI
ncbi:16S rRNA (cytosine(1402)-N(4))-methyltransferase RsmH [Oceanivirga miroungae]|uniref:Ribosomal RNA small subunit methyltransferase H n=1 Tax=Oceanivirga miroungae TaxID=1130046 RepID=A0A6I8MB53_9FUSO|nr:16S rRNA (cytosine(1402)-N(4))-methyltransferase RsmH [Oceanivirga miroungae]VWL85433.1 S-adenosyl-methyltransferase MraW [Oceanivirga miroungae]